MVGDVSGPATPKVFPATQLYSGVNSGGGAQDRVAIAAQDATGIAWSSMDQTIASVTGTDQLASVVANQTGSTMIAATVAGMTFSIPITVNAYDAADLAAGQNAFEHTYMCGGCHSGPGGDGPDITPSGIGKHSDAQILTVVTTGITPEGAPVKIGAASHSFAVSPGSAESRGIPAYLRSLTPGTPVDEE
jgi:hypothetical protein